MGEIQNDFNKRHVFLESIKNEISLSRYSPISVSDVTKCSGETY